jgi:hypothetical protein
MEIETTRNFSKFKSKADDKEYKEEKRTIQQNRALHLFFRLLAEKLNDAGYDIKKVIKFDVPWDEHTVKKFLWKPIQKAVLHKDSTTKLLKLEEIDKVYDVLNINLGEKFGIYQEFPSIERVMEEEEQKLKKSYEQKRIE